MRLFGFKFRDGNRFAFTWAEFYFGTLGLALEYSARAPYSDYGQHVHFRIPGVQMFIQTPWNHVGGDHAFDAPSWGFYYSDKALVLKWGKRSKFIYMPWDWKHVRHDVLMADGTWCRNPKEPWSLEGKWQETHPYIYILRSGNIQERTATIGVEEREWRWRWFARLPFPRKISRTIDVKFSDEVGERSGSWKGGTIGCGYEMKPGETPFRTLHRMRREREFC